MLQHVRRDAASVWTHKTAITNHTNKEPPRETPLESLRRYNVFHQLMEAYQFVNCHPKMATIIIGVGVCVQLPSVCYYSCYYLNFLSNTYSTVLPNLMTLFKFGNVTLDNVQPPWYMMLFCSLNLVTCYLGLVCIILCIYLMLPFKASYVTVARKRHERRRLFCVLLAVVLTLSICYQIGLSLLRGIRFFRSQMERDHLVLLSASKLSAQMHAQGTRSFWTLHAYRHVPCCLTREPDSDAIGANLPPECCLLFGKEPTTNAVCGNLISAEFLLPDCVSLVLNLASDLEVTMDTQMQLFLLLSCAVMFVLKYALHPHMRMLCHHCQPTYGWVGMKRGDN